MSEPLLAVEFHSDDEIIDEVTVALAIGRVRSPAERMRNRPIGWAYLETNGKARKVVPHALEFLRDYIGQRGEIIPPGSFKGFERLCLEYVERRIKRQAGGPVRGAIAWLLLRLVATQIVTWLVEWFLSQYSVKWRTAFATTHRKVANQC